MIKRADERQKMIGELTILFADTVGKINRDNKSTEEINALKEVLDILSAPGPKNRTVDYVFKTARTRCALRGLIRVEHFLDLSSSARQKLYAHGIVSVKDVVLRSHKEWLNLSGINKKVVDELEEAVADHDLRLGMDSDDVRRALGEAVPHAIKFGIMPGSSCTL